MISRSRDSLSKSGISLNDKDCEFEFPNGDFDDVDFVDISEAQITNLK